jgi:hypothetical protein
MVVDSLRAGLRCCLPMVLVMVDRVRHRGAAAGAGAQRGDDGAADDGDSEDDDEEEEEENDDASAAAALSRAAMPSVGGAGGPDGSCWMCWRHAMPCALQRTLLCGTGLSSGDCRLASTGL